MPFVYLIKHIRGQGNCPLYFRRDGKLFAFRHEAVQYETKEEAEAKAFTLIAKRPELLGNLSVVRSAPF